MDFLAALKNKLIESSAFYHRNNFDFHTFPKRSFKRKAINFGKRIIFSRLLFSTYLKSEKRFQKFLKLRGLTPYLDKLKSAYSLLENEESKKWMVDLIALRLLDYPKVKLNTNTPRYWEGMKELRACRDTSKSISLAYRPFQLYYHDLTPTAWDLKGYMHTYGLFLTLAMEHYRYQIPGDGSIEVEEGDVVLDLGGCYGDTSLYFAQKAGQSGKVFVYEFIPKNIDIIHQNLELNPAIKDRVELVEHPVWDESEKEVYFKDLGANSRVQMEPFDGQEGVTTTLSVDDLVKKYGLSKIDFIKTDVEGAEPWAIRGARETLAQFKPKLAISIYHNMDDFSGIIHQIHEMNLGYRFYLDHATIHAGETVLFCKAD